MLTFAALYLLFGIVFLTGAMWIVGDVTRSHLATITPRMVAVALAWSAALLWRIGAAGRTSSPRLPHDRLVARLPDRARAEGGYGDEGRRGMNAISIDIDALMQPRTKVDIKPIDFPTRRITFGNELGQMCGSTRVHDDGSWEFVPMGERTAVDMINRTFGLTKVSLMFAVCEGADAADVYRENEADRLRMKEAGL